MFGYIRVSKPELKVKEYDMYKAVYCTLCKTLGKQYGFFTRFTLSYDFTFLALLELSLSDDTCSLERKCCACNPLKKCNYLKDANLSFSSAAAVIMLYYKLCDDSLDEKGIKKLVAKFLKFFFSFAHKKAAKKYGSIETTVKEYITAQNNIESSKEASLDAAAEPTTTALAKIFELVATKETQKRILYRLGEMMGRYIYITDCACDVEKDAKKGAFNPLGELTKKQAAERVLPQINIIISEAVKAFELLPVKRYKDILGNIIYVGLEDTVKKELGE